MGENLSLGFRKHPGDPFTVGVLHCNVGGDVRHANYAPCSLADLEASGIDYWALGHVHEPRILRAENPAIVYSGCAQGRNPREAGARGCFVVRGSAAGVWRWSLCPLTLSVGMCWTSGLMECPLLIRRLTKSGMG